MTRQKEHSERTPAIWGEVSQKEISDEGKRARTNIHRERKSSVKKAAARTFKKRIRNKTGGKKAFGGWGGKPPGDRSLGKAQPEGNAWKYHIVKKKGSIEKKKGV